MTSASNVGGVNWNPNNRNVNNNSNTNAYGLPTQNILGNKYYGFV